MELIRAQSPEPGSKQAGAVVHDAGFAGSLERQFTSLAAGGVLRRVMV